MQSNTDNATGIMFQYVTGSFVDGHGTRTTVFLKGCPLRCVWCCNPEGQEKHPELKFTSSLCDGCGRCIEVCSTGAISPAPPGEDDKIRIDRGLCTNCGKCIEVCYTGAMDCFGKRVTVDELFNTVKKGEQFYRASGGGVTIGGGEPTLQAHFTLSLLRKCQENYIHTAIDTCGYTLTEDGFKILEEADLLLYDLKGIDTEKHLRNTGVSNEPILENLKRLDAMGKPIIIRAPIVPGYNASTQDIASAAAFLSGLKSVERVDLMAYHEYGAVKFQQLGREYEPHIQPPTQEHLDKIKETFERHGLNVQLGG